VNIALAPLTVKVIPARSSVPLVTLRLLMTVFAASIQLLLPVTMVMLSVEPGIPLGVQLFAVFQDVDTDPFQV
jgi:hypothetical protein